MKGQSGDPMFFTPPPVTPAFESTVAARVRRQPSGPIHIGESAERLLLLRERLARGEIAPPPPALGASVPVADADRRAPLPRFEPVKATGSAYDATLAVGPSHVLVATNFALAIYGKAGDKPVVHLDLASWFPNPRPGAVMTFDPRVTFDAFSQRWVVVALSWNARKDPTKSWLLVALSTTADPMKRWASWVFDGTLAGGTTGAAGYVDYPMIAVDDRALYVSMNMFKTGGTPGKLRIFPKQPLLDGKKTTFVDFIDLRNPDTKPALAVQPCQPSAPASSAYLVNTQVSASEEKFVTVWTVDGAPSSPTLSCRAVEIDRYMAPDLAPQKGEAKPLWMGDVRIRSASVRGDEIWFSFATRYRAPSGGVFTAARWYKIPTKSGPPSGKGELRDDNVHYCYPSVYPDARGNVFMVASRSSDADYPSLWQAFWPASGPSTKGELAPGGGPHLRCRGDVPCSPDIKGLNGWGDYNALAQDPADAAMVWAAGAIVSSPADKENWTTWIGALR